MNIISNLRLGKRFRNGPNLSLLLILSLIFSVSLTLCTSGKKSKQSSSSYSIAEEDRIWLKEFFRDLLFDNTGAYTLFGTKPLSISWIEEPLSENERIEWKEYYESLTDEERAKITFRENRYDFPENYQKWQKIKDRFPIKQYLFGTFRLNEKTEILVFLNVEMTLRTILENYEDFKRVLGFDFDPLQVVFEVESKESLFWNKVAVHDHALLGILLGYGRDNAWFFEWEKKYENAKNAIGDFTTSLPWRVYEMEDIDYPDPQHFILPVFGSYGLYPNDKPLFARYKKEREQIQRLYKGRDEVDVALEWFTR